MESTTPRQRLTDRQALAIIGGYFVLRQITSRAGVAFIPNLLNTAPAAIPLLTNRLSSVLLASAESRSRPLSLAGIAAASMFIGTLGNSMLFWAGWRFGPKLAELGAREGTFWAGIWNPKQVARAHRWLERWGILAVAGTRAIGLFSAPVGLVAGSSRMNVRKFTIAQITGGAIWTTAAIWLDIRAGNQWPWLTDRIKTWSAWSLRIGLILLALTIVAVVMSGGGKEQPKPAESPPAE